MSQEIGKGAEATVVLAEENGKKIVVKTRFPKEYRHPDLDRHLRNMRTKNESKIILEAGEAGVNVPAIYKTDLKESSIKMEYIEGKTAKEIIDSGIGAKEVCEQIGETVAKLHSHNLAHGDLTTSNMIVRDGKLYLIDFSMGKRMAETEDMGVDFHLLERAFSSAHSGAENAFKTIVESYKKHNPDADRILERVEVIKKRARYT